jgi:nucleoside-diphosphate-sugar epimerase
LLRSIVKTEKISRISHHAAVSSVKKSIADPVTTMEINIAGTANLFHIASEYRCKRIVFASSSAIYGDAPGLPKKESMTPCPKSPYAMSNAAKEMLGNVFSDLYNSEIIGLRYFNVYGKKQDPASDYAAVIPKFISNALQHEPIPIDGDGRQTIDFIYIDDVVDANLKALLDKPVTGNLFNIAQSEQTSVLSLAQIILEITKSRSEIVFRPARTGDIRESLGDSERAKKHLGFRSQFTLRQGLTETVNWYREHFGKRCAA